MRIKSKDLKEQYKYIIALPYNFIDYIEPHIYKIGYKSSNFGWDFDAFELTSDVCIIQGYRPFNSKNINKEKEEKIKNVLKGSNNILKDFVKSCYYYENYKKQALHEVEYITNEILNILKER